MTEYKINLSTTEPNNYVGIVKLRHGDVNSQTIVAQIVENGQPKSFKGLQPFFCLMAQEVTGQGVSEESIVSFDASKGTLRYIVSDNALQMVGRNEAYFSFRKQKGGRWIEQFSTRNFHYIVEKSIYSQPFKDSNYWWTFKELNRIFNQYIEDGKNSWEEFVNQNKEILESVDPGGKILSELLAARNGKPNLKTRIDDLENETTAQLAKTAEQIGVSPEQFGAVGDGVYDDTVALQTTIDYCIANNTTLTATSHKTYLISNPLTITGLVNCDFKHATIKVTGTLSSVFYINTSIQFGGIKNVTIDGSSSVADAIYVNYCANFYIQNVNIFNFNSSGIYVIRGYELICNNINIRNNTENDAYGIFIATSDSSFTDVIIVNCKTAVCSTSGVNYFTRVHGWIAIGSMLPDSVFFDVQSAVVVNSCVNDTFFIGYKIKGANSLLSVGCRNYYNPTYYNPNNISLSPYIIYYDTPTGTSTKETLVFGMMTTSANMMSEATHFSNVDKNLFRLNYSIKDTNRFKWADNIDNIPDGTYESDVIPADGWSVDDNVNKIKVKNNRVIMEFNVSTSSITSGELTIGHIPPAYKPSSPFVVTAMQSTSGWSLGDLIYCYIDGVIKVKVTDTTKGNYIIVRTEWDI